MRYDRTPPHRPEAEQALLGAMFLNPDAMDIAIAAVGDPGLEPFWVPEHKLLFDAMRDCHVKGEPIDMVTLGGVLEGRGELDKIGGYNYLATVENFVPTSANADYYANIVRDAALHRAMIRLGTNAVTDAYKAEESPIELITRTATALDALAMSKVRRGAVKIDRLAPGAAKELEAVLEGRGSKGVTTGITHLDKMINGLQKQDLIILAARPSVGKTATALNITLSAARSGKSVLIFSAEMSQEKIVERILCAAGGIDTARLRSGFMARGEMPKIARASEEIARLGIYIDDTPNPNISMLRATARQHARDNGGVDLIVIDYLGLIESDGKFENRNVEVSRLSKQVKGLARELDAPILCLSQLSREAAKGADPDLSHLRDSGSIEQDADVVLMLNKEVLKDGGDGIKISVKKQRNGPIGDVFARFIKAQQWIGDLDGDMAGPPEYSDPDDDREPIENQYEEDDTPF